MSDSNKQQIVELVKQYVALDSQISDRKREIKQLKSRQDIVSQSLMELMRDNKIDCFDLSAGKIVYKKTKVKKAISKGFLNDTLIKYFNGNQSQVENLEKYIMSNRVEVVKENIVLRSDKT